MEIIRSDQRGFADHDWLRSYHTFSFAGYYNPQRIHFGALRVLNDDEVQGNKGFGSHPHDNMEIISIPLSGALTHKDSTGNEGVIVRDEVQVMSAGNGVVHSEMNAHQEIVNFLQIWIFPNQANVQPRYDQKKFESSGCLNNTQLLVSPDGREGSLWIYQDAFISRITTTTIEQLNYSWYLSGNALLLFVLEGIIELNNEILNRRDTALLNSDEDIRIKTTPDTQILFIEVPVS